MKIETIVKENVNGYKMKLIKGDWPLTDSVVETESWEPRTTQFIKDNLKPGQVFVDVGASVGYYTLLASGLVGSSGKVYAFEPLEENFEVLTKNLADNGIKNVIVNFTVLSDKEELKTNIYGKNIGGQWGTDKGLGKNSRRVNNISFDKLNKKERIVPDMIKIDVEGSQMEVIKGMEKVLSADKEMTIIIEDYTGDSVEWLKEKFGFKIVTTDREPGNYMLVKNQKAVKAKLEPFTFHLLGTFNTPTNKKEGVGYAFCSKIMHIAKALRSLGHKVIFYGAEGSEVECDEFVEVLKKKELPEKLYVEEGNHPANLLFNTRAIAEIKKRHPKYFRSRDFLLIPTGSYQKPVADAVDMPLQVEVGIGYRGVFARYKIFESYSWMQWHYGRMGMNSGVFTDAVIPPIFDLDDFQFSEEKGDYFLYLGRIVQNKGVEVAIETCKAIGAKLKIAGIDSGMKIEEDSNIELVGFADSQKRKELLSKAKAVFVPTIYIEPFGYIIMEAAASGTPVITTDWGSFPEIVQHGKTGFRARSLAQFIMAAKNIDQIKPKDCRDWAAQFTSQNIAPMYQQYFEQLQNLYGKGWYSKIETDNNKLI
jgi:FkbM family methyltransferase